MGLKLTMAQRMTLNDLCKWKVARAFLGKEPGTEDPVVWISDRHREFPMVIRRRGNGDLAQTCEQLSEQERLLLRGIDADYLLSLPIPDLQKHPELMEEHDL